MMDKEKAYETIENSTEIPKVVIYSILCKAVEQGLVRWTVLGTKLGPDELSVREIQIINSLLNGNSNKSIARECDISVATVKVHVKAAMRKTKTHNRVQLTLWALAHGFKERTGERIGA